MKQTIKAFVCIFFFAIAIMLFPSTAHAGKVVLDGSSSASNGEEYTIAIRCVENGTTINGNITFKFNTDIFSFVSCDTDGYTVNGDTIQVTGKSVKITFKAIGSGDAYVVARATDANGADMTAAGITVKVSGATVETDDPEEEDPDVSEPEEEGEDTNNEEAGEDDDVTEPAESYLYVDGEMYYVTTTHWDELINAGYEPENIMVSEILTSGLRYQQSNIILVHLIHGDTGNDMGYYVFEPETQTVCPYIGYGQNSEDADKLADVQDNYSKLYEKYEALKQKNRSMLIGIIIGVVVLVIALISVLLVKRFQHVEDEVNYKRTDGGAPLKKQGEYLNAIANNSHEDEDDFDEEDDVEVDEAQLRDILKSSMSANTSFLKEDTEDVEIIDLEDL